MNLRYILICALSLTAVFPRPTHAQWTKKANIPTGVTDAACAFAVNGTVYFGGGSAGAKRFYAYDPVSGTWTKKADLPVVKMLRAFGVSFAIGSKGYVALGQSDTGDFNHQQASVTNDLWEYDPASDSWNRKADFPGAARDGAMVFVVNGKAYIGAGVDAAQNYLGDMYEYDPTQNKWTKKADLGSGAIGFPMGFAIGNMGYMTGGGVYPNESTDAWSYDPVKDEWSSISPFPGAGREAGVAFSIDTLGYVGLGESAYTQVYSDFYSYNPNSDTWTLVKSLFPFKAGLGWPAAAASGESAYVGGGATIIGGGLAYENTWYSFSSAAPLTAATLIAPANNASINDTAIDFSWQAVPTATGYHLEISLNSSFSGQLFEQQVTTPTAHVQTLLPGTFYWRVAAKRPDGEGPWSEVRSFSEGLAGVANTKTETTLIAYPNPAHDVLTLSGNESVTVYDLLGREVLSAHSATGTLDVSSLPNGEYRCVLTTPNSMVSTTRFVKQ